jgi:hypothetical protein
MRPIFFKTKSSCFPSKFKILNSLTTEIKVDGTLSSNGQGGSVWTGGGSGGSILITTSLFDGTGSIEVFLLSHLLKSYNYAIGTRIV